MAEKLTVLAHLKNLAQSVMKVIGEVAHSAAVAIEEVDKKIPTKVSQLENDSNFKTTDTTYDPFQGATSAAAGDAGLVPAPTTENREQYLRGDGTWATPPTPTDITGNAATATKLKTTRKINVVLNSDASPGEDFDGSRDVSIVPTGTLPIGRGGTGATTAAEARESLGITPESIQAVPLAGGTMTGRLTAAPEATGIAAVRNIRCGSILPDMLEEGEIFILLAD